MKILKNSTYNKLIESRATAIAESAEWAKKYAEMQQRKDNLKTENVRLSEIIALRDQEIHEMRPKLQVRDKHGHFAKKSNPATITKKREK